jgi:glycosyltransferase involved in cell wall biosynthesis
MGTRRSTKAGIATRELTMTDVPSHADTPPTGIDSGGHRPGLAIVSRGPTPYRTHLHRRLAAEIPEFKLHSLFTHSTTIFPWAVHLPEEIRPVRFDTGDDDQGPAWWRHPLRDLRKAGRIARYLHEHDTRAVVINGYNSLTLLRLIAHCRRTGIRVFVHSDSNVKADEAMPAVQAWMKRRLVGWVIRSCDGVMPMGRLGQQYFEKYGADPRWCFWVPPEPDYGVFSSAPPEAVAAFRAERGMAGDRRYLLFGGRLAPVKRVDLLIDAFARIAGQRPEWDLVIAGEGELRNELQRRVPDSLTERVKWLGFLDVDEMRLVYHASDVLVLPSDYEPWALVVTEAMAAGCLVVASDVVGAAWDLIEDRVSGRVFPSGNLEALTEALMQVTDPRSFRRYRDAVAPALEAWRKKVDPVEGVRAALRSVGLLD